MAHEVGRWALLGATVAKGVCDLLQDVYLLRGRDTAAAWAMLSSVFFLALSVIIAFSWFAGVAQVVVAHDTVAGCTCYFQRQDLLVLASFVLPLALLAQLLTRCGNALKALTYGSYLYSFNENVPVRLLRANVARQHIDAMTDSLLVPVLAGDALPFAASASPSPSESSGDEGAGAAAFLDGWVPAWPALAEAPTVLKQALAALDPTYTAAVAVPVLWESAYVVGAVRGLLRAEEVGWAAALGAGFMALLDVATAVLLLCAASRRWTPEARLSVYLVWLQKWAVWMTHGPLVPLLYARAAACLARFAGAEPELTPEAAFMISTACAYSVLALAICHILKNYADFLERGRRLPGSRRRPVLLPAGGAAEVELMRGAELESSE